MPFKNMRNNHVNYILCNQILKSGTSIGANVKEALYAQSKKYFVSKMNIALKETSETEYWLELIMATDYIEVNIGKVLLEDCLELKRILLSIVKTSKRQLIIKNE